MPRLKFNTKIYKKDAILEAVSAYSNLASFSLSDNKSYTEVTINKIEPSIKKIISDEFTNYVLGMTKKCL